MDQDDIYLALRRTVEDLGVFVTDALEAQLDLLAEAITETLAWQAEESRTAMDRAA